MAILTANPQSLTVPQSGGTYYITITYENEEYPQVSQWMVGRITGTGYTAEFTSTAATSAVLKIVVDATTQPREDTRFINIGVTPVGNSQNIYFQFTFKQETNAYRPVWEDDYFTFPFQYRGSVNYDIKDVKADEIIYSGRAYEEPNNNNIKINVGRIVNGYLSNNFPEVIDDEPVHYLTDYSHTYNIMVGDVVEGTYTYYNSWAYEPVTGYSISVPIRKTIDRRQVFVYSLYRGDNSNDMFIYDNGFENHNIYIDDNQALICDKNLNEDVREVIITKQGDIEVDRFTVIDSCYDWCLYYSNAYGGWDSLLIKGNVVKTDKINSQYYKKEYNNKTYEFGRTKYLNIVTPSYKLYTDWFYDEEQSKLHHLLESTEVYLHNLVTDKIEPVIITNTECEYKTYTNNGKKKFYNTINVEVAQEKFRQ